MALAVSLRRFGSKLLRLETINLNLIKAQYAVRGRVVKRKGELEKLMAQGEKFPFDKFIPCSIGNPQALGQSPLTFIRQVLSLLVNPELLQSDAILGLYPEDVVSRAKTYFKQIAGGIGAYSESQGFAFVREAVARFIENRDQCGPTNPGQIYLTTGGSQGAEAFLTLLISGYKDGVLIPVPVYPLYSALLDLKCGSPIGYELGTEDGKWVIDLKTIKKSVDHARTQGISPRCIVVINPGNPTGQLLHYENMRSIVDYCHDQGLIILADEVYQDNVYEDGARFHSFRKVVIESGLDLEVVSIHSLSKGYHGECGIRGGYTELLNVLPEVQEQFLKLLSISLCSNTIGQLAVDLMVNPPRLGDASYPLYLKEKTAILTTLKRKSRIVFEGLNSMKNITTNKVEGAMYAFPEIRFSPAALKAAATAKMPVDMFYSLQLLENTGIMVVPGSGFGQKKNTWHFRTTILPQESAMATVIEKMNKFNDEFHNRYQ